MWVFSFEEFKYFHKCYSFIFPTLSVHISSTQNFLAEWNAMGGGSVLGGMFQPSRVADPCQKRKRGDSCIC